VLSIAQAMTLPPPALVVSSTAHAMTSPLTAPLSPSAPCHLCDNNTATCSRCVVPCPPPAQRECRRLLESGFCHLYTCIDLVTKAAV
jgi:hypothetical protein